MLHGHAALVAALGPIDVHRTRSASGTLVADTITKPFADVTGDGKSKRTRVAVFYNLDAAGGDAYHVVLAPAGTDFATATEAAADTPPTAGKYTKVAYVAPAAGPVPVSAYANASIGLLSAGTPDYFAVASDR